MPEETKTPSTRPTVKKAPAKKPAAKAVAPSTTSATPSSVQPVQTEAQTEAAAVSAKLAPQSLLDPLGMLSQLKLPGFEQSGPFVPDAARTMAEQSIETARDLFETSSARIEEQSAAIEESLHSAQISSKAFNEQVLDAARANMAAGLSLFTDLMGAKSVSDFVEIQSSFASQQADALTQQGKSLQETLAKGYEDISAPLKDAAQKAMETIKAA